MIELAEVVFGEGVEYNDIECGWDSCVVCIIGEVAVMMADYDMVYLNNLIN